MSSVQSVKLEEHREISKTDLNTLIVTAAVGVGAYFFMNKAMPVRGTTSAYLAIGMALWWYSTQKDNVKHPDRSGADHPVDKYHSIIARKIIRAASTFTTAT